MAFVTRGDLVAILLRLLDEKQGVRFFRRLLSSETERVKLTWQLQRTSVRNWYEIPRVFMRQNMLVTGKEDLSTFHYVATEVLQKKAFVAVSLGCGAGSRELSWAETGCFERIVSIDISEERINEAKRKVAGSMLASKVEFIPADLLRYPLQPDS